MGSEPTLKKIDLFQQIATTCRLSGGAARELDDDGFAVVEGPVTSARMADLAAAYDRTVEEAIGPDKNVGRTTTRVHDLVNRGIAFDNLYTHSPVLAACCRTIGQRFKLSNMLARSVHPGADAQALHVDVIAGQDGWPMLGFILMIDEFTAENGAIRFLPGSHRQEGAAGPEIPESALVAACGPPGAVVVYHGSVVHGHGANRTNRPRRSIQGAYIPHDAKGFGLAARMDAETRERLAPLALYLLAD